MVEQVLGQVGAMVAFVGSVDTTLLQYSQLSRESKVIHWEGRQGGRVKIEKQGKCEDGCLGESENEWTGKMQNDRAALRFGQELKVGESAMTA